MTQNDEKFSRRSMLRRVAAVFGVVGMSALAAACGPRAERAATAAAARPAPPPPPPAAASAAAAADAAVEKKARYQSRPHGRERCAGCIHFQAPNGCEIVEGQISPRGWCRNFTPKA